MIHLKNVMVFTVKYSKSRVKCHATFAFLMILIDVKKYNEKTEN